MSLNLYIRKITPAKGVLMGHSEALMNAKFPITRTTCSVVSVSAGHSTHTADNLYLGQLPKTIVIGMVEDDAYNGLCTKNPYNFKSFDLRSKILSANGVAVPGTPLKIEDGDTAICYQTLFYGLSKLEQESGRKTSSFQALCAIPIYQKNDFLHSWFLSSVCQHVFPKAGHLGK